MPQMNIEQSLKNGKRVSNNTHWKNFEEISKNNRIKKDLVVLPETAFYKCFK